MSRNYFQFKRFTVEQEKCAMKVGTDGVLLGAWCRTPQTHDETILDIGTGTGVIALQLAQRTELYKTTIDAVEADEASCRQAAENFNRSPWRERLRTHHSSIQDFARNATPEIRYDHIVSNPPWFVDSLASPDAMRNLARHTHSLNYDDLMKCCFMLMKPAGRISLIVPAGTETEKIIEAAHAYDFAVSRLTEVHSTPKSGPKRTMLEFSHRTATAVLILESSSLVIEDGAPGSFTAEYRALTRDFYLYF